MNISKVFIRLSLAILVIFALSSRQPAEARYAAIVLDAETGEVLHSVNADTRNYPASLTKMMTLYMLFEALDRGDITLEQKLSVSRRATRARPSKLGLRKGESITVREAIGALVAKSANDVAVVVAEALGGTVKDFAKAMTKRARTLGMTRTTFRNPHGLPNRGHLSTARDMALLSRLLITHFPHYYEYFATKSFEYHGHSYKNHNKLLGKYQGADGIKTGYTDAAGYNLAASAERDGTRLIAIVFGGRSATSRDRQVQKLLDRGFAKIAHEQGSRDDDRAVAEKPQPALPALPLAATAHTDIQTSANLVSDTVTPARPGDGKVVEIAVIEERALEALRLAESDLPIFGGTQKRAPITDAEPAAKKIGKPKSEPVQTAAVANPAPAAQGSKETEPEPAKQQRLAVAPTTKQEKPAATPPTPPAPASGDWVIQIGAFYKMAPAAKHASKAADKLSQAGRHYEVAVTTGERNARTVYRARLAGLSKRDAFNACKTLKRHKFDCFAMAPRHSQSN
jgi:D-alanyl-D-alanine carboxypeptidase